MYTFFNKAFYLNKLLIAYLCTLMVLPPSVSSAAAPEAAARSDAAVSSVTVPVISNETEELIPSAIGSCIARIGYDNPDADKELLVLIDAHDNLSAQYNISHILSHLTDQRRLHKVYLEGASGTLKPSDYFNVFDDADITRSTSSFLLENGFITGSEYYSLTHSSPVAMQGAERNADYRENLEYLRKLKQLHAEQPVQTLLDRFTDTLRDAIPSDFAELDRQYIDCIIHGKDIMAFVAAMGTLFESQIMAQPGKYPVISRYIYVSKYGPSTTLGMIRVLSNLQKTYSGQADVLKRITAVKKQLVSNPQEYRAVQSAADLLKQYRSDIDSRILNACGEYLAHLAHLNAMAPTDLYIRILEAYKKLYTDQGYPAGLFDQRNILIGIFKGVSLTLAPGELSFFRVDTADTETALHTLLLHDDSSDEFFRKMLQSSLAELIETAKELVCSFYTTVEARNESIHSIVTTDIPSESTAVLVIGGYHKHICEQFVRDGFRVSVIAPNLTLGNNLERGVSYSDYLSGVFTSLERMIYYAWSTIISPLISQSMELLPSRKDAIAPIVARQLALMLGTGLTIQKFYESDITDAVIKTRLMEMFKNAQGTNNVISRTYDQLFGSEAAPKWPKIIDYMPVADKQGVFATFSIGGQLFGLEVVSSQAQLSDEQRAQIDKLRNGYTLSHTIIHGDESFIVTISPVTDTPAAKQVSGREASADAYSFFYTARPHVTKQERETLGKMTPSVKSSMLGAMFKAQESLQTARENFAYEQIDGIAPDGQPDGGFSLMHSLIASTIGAVQSMDSGREPLVISIPGESRPVAIYAVPMEVLKETGVPAATIVENQTIKVYLPYDLLEHNKGLEFFQLLKLQLDVSVYGIPLFTALVHESATNTFLNAPGQPSQRILNDLHSRYNPNYLGSSLESVYTAYEELGDYIAQEPAVLNALQSDTSLTAQQRRYAEDLVRKVTREARILRMTHELLIAQRDGTLRGYTFKKFIHAGGFGTVFLAEKDGKPYVIKMVNSLIGKSAEYEQYKRTHLYEALLTQIVYGDLDTTNCGKFELGENRFIVMPYINGTTLEELAPSLSMLEVDKVNLSINIARELQRIHSAGIIFNDLKPNNILLKTPNLGARIIDFGSAIRPTASLPRSLEQVTVASTVPYTSPEMQGFNQSYDKIKMLTPQYHGAELTAAEFNDFMDDLYRIIGTITEYPYGIDAYDTLVDDALPALRDRFEDGEYNSFDEIIAAIQPALLTLMYSLLDERSDIYCFGVLLREVFYKTSAPPQINTIIDTCTKTNPDERYQSMDDVIKALTGYYKAIAHQDIATAHWIGHSVADTRNVLEPIVASWDKIPFTADMADGIREFSLPLKRSAETRSKHIAQTLAPNDPSFDAGFPLFINVLSQIEQQLAVLQQPQDRLTVTVAGDDRPVHLYVVSHDDLAGIGINALTMPFADRIEMYLPSMADGIAPSVFFQLFKHELDESILGYPHTLAVLLESAINNFNPSDIGAISDRMEFEFSYRLNNAQNKHDVGALYDVGAYFRQLIANQKRVADEINERSALTEQQRHHALMLSQAITQKARLFALHTDLLVARRSGSLYGFDIIRSVDSGFSGEVFLARKDGRDWAIKVPAIDPADDPELTARKIRAITHERAMTGLVYGDIYEGYAGDFETGETECIITPFTEGFNLADTARIAQLDEQARVDIALAILEECMRVEMKELVHNDLTAENILIDPGTKTARIIDFAATVREGSPLPWFIAVDFRFAPPELLALWSDDSPVYEAIRMSDAMLYGSVSSATVDTLDILFKEHFDHTGQQAVYAGIAEHVLPALRHQIKNGDITTIEQLKARSKRLLNQYFYRVIDTRRDIFSLGVVFDDHLFPQDIPAPLQTIIDRARSNNREHRYGSFKELYDRLSAYRDKLHTPSIQTTHWVGNTTTEPSKMRTAVDAWELNTIPAELAVFAQTVREQLVRDYPLLKEIVHTSLTPFDSSYDGGIDRFIMLLDSLADSAERYDGMTPYLEFTAPEQIKPLRLYLVSPAYLDELEVSAITLHRADAIEMYLPDTLLTVHTRNLFFQLLKHEVDESVYLESHTVSVLLESLMNTSVRVPGTISDRMRYEFNRKTQEAVKAGSTDALLAAYTYFTELIKNQNQAIDNIKADTTLTGPQKEYAAALAHSVTQNARVYALMIEQELATRNATLRGFTFNEVLARNGRSTIYRAAKDGTDWLVSLYAVNDQTDPQTLHAQVQHAQPAALASRVYDAVYPGMTGDFSAGEQPFTALPYRGGIPLIDTKMTLPADIDGSRKIALAILDEAMKLEQHGILYNHITPFDVFIDIDNRTVQFADFSAARARDTVPDSLDGIALRVDTDYKPYAAPEIKQLVDLLPDLKLIPELSRAAFTGSIDDIFINTFQAGIRIKFTGSHAGELIELLMPRINALSESPSLTVDTLAAHIEDALIEHFYASIDHRADIYSIGAMLKYDLFWRNLTPELRFILDKATAHDPADRYESFGEFHRALATYDTQELSEPVTAESAQQTKIDYTFIETYFSAQLPSELPDDIAQIAANWEQVNFDKHMAKPIQTFRQSLMNRLTRASDSLAELYSGELTDDAGFSQFDIVLLELQSALENMDTPQPVIKLTGISPTRPVVVHLVYSRDLDAYNTSMLTVSSDSQIDLYIPFGAMNTATIATVLQKLKFIVDTQYTGLPAVLSYTAESILNSQEPKDITKVSDRVTHEFTRRVMAAVGSHDLNRMYDVHAYLNTFIDNLDTTVAMLEADEQLTPFQKDTAQKTAVSIAAKAAFCCSELEYHIAEHDGTLRGFDFIGKIGSGEFSNVYMANKDDKMWVVKMLKRSYSSKLAYTFMNVYQPSFETESVITALAYDDVYTGDSGRYELGQNKFIAVPYGDGATLDTVSTTGEKISQRISRAIAIVESCLQMEKTGVIHNDIKPSNIFVYKDGSTRIIDFGCAAHRTIRPPTLDAVIVGVEAPYASPELVRFSRHMSRLRKLYHDISDLHRDQLTAEHLEELTGFLSSVAKHSMAPAAFETLINQTIPNIYTRFAALQIASPSDMMSELEPHLIPAMYTLIDSRSDQFSVGMLFKTSLLSDTKSDEIDTIIARATNHNPEKRYGSFMELLTDLKHVHEIQRAAESRFSFFHSPFKRFFTAHFVGNYPVENQQQQIAQLSDRLTPKPWAPVTGLDTPLLEIIADFREFMQRNKEQWHEQITRTLYPDNPSNDAGLQAFIDTLISLELAVSQQDMPADSLIISVPGESRPVYLTLVSETELFAAGTNALTVASPDRIDLYLPYEMLYADDNTIFFYILKHELDEFVHNTPHTLAVLQESIIDSIDGTVTIGKASHRILEDFQAMIERAVQSRNIDNLYRLQRYFKELFTNEPAAIEQIDANNSLSGIQKNRAKLLATDISQHARIFSMIVEKEIAAMYGTLRGYSFKKKLGDGGFSSVYLAEKDGQLRVVKLPRIEFRERQYFDVFRREEQITHTAYDDVVFDSGDIAQGDIPFIAVPYYEGERVTTAALENIDEKTALELAMSMIEELARLADRGIVHNDITPDNIMINIDNRSTRIIDFGCAVDDIHKPLNFKDSIIGLSQFYSSPEASTMAYMLVTFRDHFKMHAQTPAYQLDLSFFVYLEQTVQSCIKHAVDPSKGQEILRVVLPQVKEMIETGKIIKTDQVYKILEPYIVELLYSMIDHRTDLYAAGCILNLHLFGHLQSEGLVPIVEKATAQNRNDRYSSFDELYADLKAYYDARYADSAGRFRTTGERDDSGDMISAHWVAHAQPTDSQLIQQADNWQSLPFPGTFSRMIRAYHSGLSRQYSGLRHNASVLRPGDSSYDGNLQQFMDIIKNMELIMEMAAPNDNILRLYIPGSKLPVALHLVSRDHLDTLSVSALTVRTRDSFDVYLPADLLTEDRIPYFFQTLKHEIDEFVFDMPHTEAVLLESLLNRDANTYPGSLSNRVILDMSRRIATAYQTKDLDTLYGLQDYFTSLIAGEQQVLAEILANKRLHPAVKEKAEDFARNISNAARLFGPIVEKFIADLGGELRGFHIREHLGDGSWGSVYRAQLPDGTQWAVKLVNMLLNLEDQPQDLEQRLFDGASSLISVIDNTMPRIRMHINDGLSIAQVYDDAIIENPDQFTRGHNQILAVPYEQGTSLKQALETYPDNPTARANLAVAIAQELSRFDGSGVVHNDIKPDNIFVTADGSCRILDFGTSLNTANTVHVQELPAASTYSFASPEVLEFIPIINALNMEFRSIKNIKGDTIPVSFFERIQQTLRYSLPICLDDTYYNELVAEVIPEFTDYSQNEQCSVSPEDFRRFEQLVVKHCTTLTDTRSDVYSFGIILRDHLFKDNPPAAVQHIIDQATDRNRDFRYDSFTALYEDLREYRDDLIAAKTGNQLRTALRNATWVSIPAIPASQFVLNEVASWQSFNFEPVMAPVIHTFAADLAQRLPAIRDTISQTIISAGQADTQSDGLTGTFIDILDSFGQAVEQLETTQDYIDIRIPDESRPVRIRLVARKNLLSLPVESLSLALDDRIELYLPYEDLTGDNPAVFFQALKYELDTGVYSISQPVARLLESLLNDLAQQLYNNSFDIGGISNRMQQSMHIQFATSLGLFTVDDLQRMKAEFTAIIESEDSIISSLTDMPSLTAQQRTYATRLAAAVAHEAVFYAVILDQLIVERGGNLHGFEFKELLGESEFRSRYLAQKDSALWVVTLLNAAQLGSSKKLNQAIQAMRNEANITTLINRNTYTGFTGYFEQGDNEFYAFPYSFTQSLADTIDRLPPTETDRVQLAMALVAACADMEQAQVVHTALHPRTFTLNMNEKNAAISHLATAYRTNLPPTDINRYAATVDSDYSAPELVFVASVKPFLRALFARIETITVDESVLAAIQHEFDDVFAGYDDQDYASRLRDHIMPYMEQLYLRGERITPSLIISYINKRVSSFFASQMTYKTDIYSVGKILLNDIFPEHSSDELRAIARKAANADPDQRFASFDDLYQALSDYTSRPLDYPADDLTDDGNNVAFGTICEVDETKHTGLNTLIARQFEKETPPVAGMDKKTDMVAAVQSWNYSAIAQDERAGEVLRELGIATEIQWNNWRGQLVQLIQRTDIYLLPADDYLLWVNQRFAAAHCGTFANKQNIYVTAKMMDILAPSEQAQVLIHELLHLAGISHTQAEALQGAVSQRNDYDNAKQIVYLIANIELREKTEHFTDTEYQRFVRVFTPAFRQAFTNRSSFDRDAFDILMRKHSFSPSFSNRIYNDVNRLLTDTAREGTVPQTIRAIITGDDIRKMLDQIGSTSVAVRMRAIDGLIAVGKPAVPYLVQEMDSPTASVRERLLYILGAIGDMTAMRTAVTHLNDPSGRVRVQAQNTMVNLATKAHAPFLHNLIRESTDTATLVAALKSCLKIEEYPSVNSVYYYEHPHAQVRELTDTILRKQGIDRSAEIGFAADVWEHVEHLNRLEDSPQLESALDAFTELGVRVTPFLERALNMESETIVTRAAFLLGERGSLKAVRPLLAIAANSTPARQERAAELLTNPDYSDHLINILSSENTDISAQAATILGITGYTPAVEQLTTTLINATGFYSLPSRQQSLFALSKLLDKRAFADLLAQTVIELEKREPEVFDDSVVFLEIAVLIKEMRLKRGAPVLRNLLRNRRPSIRKAAIEGLTELGDASDVSMIRFFGLQYDTLRPTVAAAEERLNKPWPRIKANFKMQIGHFVGGAPADRFFTADTCLHKGDLVGIEQIQEYAVYEDVVVDLRFGSRRYAFTLKVDVDFAKAYWQQPLTNNTIAVMVEDMLGEDEQLAESLAGKTISLALLTKSFRMSENHREDNFIGMNEAIFHIEDRGAMLALFKELLYHELKHEGGMPPEDFNDFIAWESREIRSVVESIVTMYPTRQELNQFIKDIVPVFNIDSFFLYILDMIAQGRITQDELFLIEDVDLGQSYMELIGIFEKGLATYRQGQLHEYTRTDLVENLHALGLLEQDIRQLLYLSKFDHIHGSYESVGISSPHLTRQIQRVFLDEYVRRLLPRILEMHGYVGMFDDFFNSMVLEDLDPLASRESVTSFKQFMSKYTGVTLDATKSSDGYFLSQYALEYLMSLFTGQHSILEMAPGYRAMQKHLVAAIKKRETFLKGQLRFKSDAIAGTTYHRQAQVAYVEHLFNVADTIFLPTELYTEEDKTSALLGKPAPIKKITIEQSNSVDTSI